MSLVDRLSALAGDAGVPLDGIGTAGGPTDELDDVLLRCLAPRADRRPAIDELQNVLGDVGSAW